MGARTLIRQGAHLFRLMAGEILTGIITDAVERDLAQRKKAHVHQPMNVYGEDPGALGCNGASYWVIVTQFRQDKLRLTNVSATPITGIRVCGLCKEVYYEEL